MEAAGRHTRRFIATPDDSRRRKGRRRRGEEMRLRDAERLERRSRRVEGRATICSLQRSHLDEPSGLGGEALAGRDGWQQRTTG